jgi:hypothetical protein
VLQYTFADKDGISMSLAKNAAVSSGDLSGAEILHNEGNQSY